MKRLAYAAAAVAALAVGVAALSALSPRFGIGSGPTPSATIQETPDPSPTISDAMWPQSSLEEVREAQELADAGDPAYTWQVEELEPTRNMDLYEAEIFARLLREELGWEEFRGIPGYDFSEGSFSKVDFIRCAPGGTNPLYPNDPEGRGCAPTIDEFQYETVRIDVAQLGQRGPSGIWVVTRWAMITPFEQVVPPSEAETTALLEGFLQARIDGEGAQEYLDVREDEIPFLYATRAGAPYERSEFEVVAGPVWPDGAMQFKVRLFAEAGATVEQFISLERYELGLGYDSEFAGPAGPVAGTTVNGHAVPVPYSILDGEVTFDAAYPWHDSWTGDPDPRQTLFFEGYEGNVVLVADPLPIGTGCLEGPAPADAQALARSIGSDPDLEGTAPVAVSVGGTPALQMDVVAAPGASVCELVSAPLVVSDTHLWPGNRMRLYLLDLPEGSSRRILAIAIVAPEARFETVLDVAAPIVDSFEFHAP